MDRVGDLLIARSGHDASLLNFSGCTPYYRACGEGNITVYVDCSGMMMFTSTLIIGSHIDPISFNAFTGHLRHQIMSYRFLLVACAM